MFLIFCQQCRTMVQVHTGAKCFCTCTASGGRMKTAERADFWGKAVGLEIDPKCLSLLTTDAPEGSFGVHVQSSSWQRIDTPRID